ncbi:MAG: tRNA (adenosine(37)-N6)-threonylcarbamoyltransferase complex ATPase subunit type 1 TsaE [Oscillospiraceae bacterium]|nr:tRNA (adenosine(37)-N6)-threonylcarbamoyltransferase complex ATPase subunit type 1 TsaE [Oscillospiraceae bacterium]
MSNDFISHSAKETEDFGYNIGKNIKSGDVVALFGEMGAGKTAFVRGLARGMGFDGEVSSPTFALVHEYPANTMLYHFDMYRIDTWDDLYSTGFFDYLDSGGVLVIEWSENIENCLPDNCIKIRISKNDNENERIITLIR